MFQVPNALDTKQPLPVIGNPTFEQFLIVLGLIVGGLGWLFADVLILDDRDIGDDLHLMGVIWLVAGIYAFVRPGGHRLTYWFYLGNRQIAQRVIGRLSWGLVPSYPTTVCGPRGEGSVHLPRGSVLISAPWAHALYANARVEPDGIVDVSGTPMPWLALLLGRAPFRAWIRVSPYVVPDLDGQSEMEVHLARRSRMWFQLEMPASAHVIIDPLNPETIAYSAGAAGESDARNLATGALPGMKQGLIERACYLVIAGATRGAVRERCNEAMGILAESGRDPSLTTKAEIDRVLDSEWGKSRTSGPLGIATNTVAIAGQRWVSFLVTKLERSAPLDALAPLLDGSLCARVGLYSWPIAKDHARFLLMVREALWQTAAGEGSRQYQEAMQDAVKVSAEIRNQGSLHRFGLVISVPEAQREDAMKALRLGSVERSGWQQATRRQDAVVRSALPLGIPELVDQRLSNASMLGMLTPWRGSGLVVPNREDGKTRGVLFGVAEATAEIVLLDPFNEHLQNNWSVFVWGMMGFGKTVTLQALTLRMCNPHPKHYLAEMKPRAFVVDHKEDYEWGPLVKHLGGEYIVASSWSDVRDINVEQACLGVNVSRIPLAQRGVFVDDLMNRQWELVSRRASSEPWPGVVVLDEMSALAATARGRNTINRTGKMARSAYWMVAFGTQDMDDALRHDETAGVGADGLVAASIKNAGTRVALRQPTMDKKLLHDRIALSDASLDYLINMGGDDGAQQRTTRGQCLLWSQNRTMPVAARVIVLPSERHLFAMNPQDRRSAFAGQPVDFTQGDSNVLSDSDRRVSARRRVARVPSKTTRSRRLVRP